MAARRRHEGSSPKRPPRGRDGDFSKQPRLLVLKTLLVGSGGLTTGQMGERLGASRSSVCRDLRALRAAGEPLEEARDGQVVRYRIPRAVGQEGVVFTTSELFGVYLALQGMRAFAGTGLDDDVRSVFEKIELTLRARDHELARGLDRKLFDVNENPRVYRERAEDMNEIVTSLLRQHELTLTHRSVKSGGVAFAFRPYSLVVYKKGLYLAGYSGHKGTVVTLPLEGVLSVERKPKAPFETPDDYHPAKLLEGRWGLFDGPPTDVRLLFSSKVVEYVARRRWHPSQRLERRPDGRLELSLRVRGTTELTSWVLGFGKEVTVLDPPSFRDAIAAELRGALAEYEGGRIESCGRPVTVE